MFSHTILELAKSIILHARKNNITISTAESCTGGLIIASLTEISGSSAVVDRGFITYTNQSKMDMLDIQRPILQKYGAVSEQIVIQMANGARLKSGSDITIAVSGVAGPTGGSQEKPVGLVHFAISTNKETVAFQLMFKGNRETVRLQTVETALNKILERLLSIENT